MKHKQIIKEQIGSCLIGMARCQEQNREAFFQRVDELFLLWSKIENITFVRVAEAFGINYYDFHNKDYEKVSNQIVIKYKKHFEDLNS